MTERVLRNYRHIEVRPIAGALGAELHGVDLARDPGDDVIAEIRQAWLDHLVVFVRGQELSPAQQLAFAQPVGPGRARALPSGQHMLHQPQAFVIVHLRPARDLRGGAETTLAKPIVV